MRRDLLDQLYGSPSGHRRYCLGSDSKDGGFKVSVGSAIQRAYVDVSEVRPSEHLLYRSTSQFRLSGARRPRDED